MEIYPPQQFWWLTNGACSSSQVGVFVDGDGISSKYVDVILQESQALGPLLRPCIFGNWDQPALQGWQHLLLPYRLEYRHHGQVAAGKNATDIALVMDVLKYLYQYGVKSFCLAVADSDYTPLVSQLRCLGCTVVVLGLNNTVQALREACTRFVSLDQPMGVDVLPIDQGSAFPGSVEESIDLEATIVRAYDQIAVGKKRWILLSDVVDQVRLEYLSFSPQTYGYKTMSKLVKARLSPIFELRPCPSRQHEQEIRKREKGEAIS